MVSVFYDNEECYYYLDGYACIGINSFGGIQLCQSGFRHFNGHDRFAGIGRAITYSELAVNTHRLLVTGERIPYESAQEIQAEMQQETTEVESAWEQEYLHGLYIALTIVLLLMIICCAVAFFGRNKDD